MSMQVEIEEVLKEFFEEHFPTYDMNKYMILLLHDLDHYGLKIVYKEDIK